MVITDINVYAYERPVVLAGGPRTGWHISLTDREGRLGWGDAAPWPGFGAPIDDVPGSLRRLAARVRDRGHADDDVLDGFPPAIAHAVSLAVADLEAQARNIPLARLYATAPALTVRSHVLIEDAVDARTAVERGATTLKLKLGRHALDDDLRRVARVRAAAPEAALRLDVNGRWSRTQADAAFDALAVHGLAWIEQPLSAADWDGLSRLRQHFSTPVALDESVVLDPGSALDVADVVVLKPMFLGALRRTLDLAADAQRRGIGVCLTHALGSPVERLGVQHLAATLDDDGVHGVGHPADGDRLSLPSGPGLGVRP